MGSYEANSNRGCANCAYKSIHNSPVCADGYRGSKTPAGRMRHACAKHERDP